MNGRKRVKQTNEGENDQKQVGKFKEIYNKICRVSLNNQQHPFQSLMKRVEGQKHPILPTLGSSTDVYKINTDKKKKPIQIYLDSVNTIYKKKDLDILINPLTYTNVFQNWSPRQIAIFQQAIIKFGKQFEYIAQLIDTKSTKEVYEFYLQWKTTSHFKFFKGAMNAANKSNLQQWV